MLSDKLKQRFCKDEKLNIQLFDEPIFRERLRLMGYLRTYEAFEQLIAERFHGNEEAFFEEYNRVKEDIIQYIKNSEAFQALNSADMNLYNSKYHYRQSDVYKESNIGKKFISIDMSKANFSALVSFSRNLNEAFHESFDWESFISKFTDIDHFKNSKYIRQVVFGNCNPKRQVTYEKYLMSLLLDRLFDQQAISSVYSLCSDEIILPAETIDLNTYHKILDIVTKFELAPLKVEYFRLGKIENTDAYIKEVYNPENNRVVKWSPKCVNPYDAPAIYRLLNEEKPQDSDLYFLHEGRLAKYANSKELRIIWEAPVLKREEEEEENYDEQSDYYHSQLSK